MLHVAAPRTVEIAQMGFALASRRGTEGQWFAGILGPWSAKVTLQYPGCSIRIAQCAAAYENEVGPYRLKFKAEREKSGLGDALETPLGSQRRSREEMPAARIRHVERSVGVSGRGSLSGGRISRISCAGDCGPVSKIRSVLLRQGFVCPYAICVRSTE